MVQNNISALRKQFKRSSLYRFYQMPKRFHFAFTYYREPIKSLLKWTLTSRETSNFTYNLQDLNIRYLASMLSVATDKPIAEIAGYCDEVRNDKELENHIRKLTHEYKQVADDRADYGRRIGWYALVRALKPRVVIETGVDKGLGSCVLAAAILRNRQEGHEGKYFGTDISPNAGRFFCKKYASAGEILRGDSINSLKKLKTHGVKVDLFINDSDHSAQYERSEYETVKDFLSENAFIIADNAHVNSMLSEFAERTGRRFLFFQERPKDHWYPGAGIGLAFPRK